MGNEELVMQEQPFHQTDGDDTPRMDSSSGVSLLAPYTFSLLDSVFDTDSSTM